MKLTKIKLVIPLITILTLGTFAVFYGGKSVYAEPSPSPSPSPATQGGKVIVCTIIVNSDGKITNGSEMPGVSFSIDGLQQPSGVGGSFGGMLPNTTFTTPVTLNADLLGNDGVNDASCVTYSNLALGNYFYSQESISNSSGWAKPLYNDQYYLNVGNLNDFFTYDEGLFKNGYGYADNANADGEVILKNSRDKRTLVVLNKMSLASPTPAPTASPTPNLVAVESGSTNSGQSQQSVTVSSVPIKTPETGASPLSLIMLVFAALVGFALSRFGKTKSVFQKSEEIGEFALWTLAKRLKGLDNL